MFSRNKEPQNAGFRGNRMGIKLRELELGAQEGKEGPCERFNGLHSEMNNLAS